MKNSSLGSKDTRTSDFITTMKVVLPADLPSWNDVALAILEHESTKESGVKTVEPGQDKLQVSEAQLKSIQRVYETTVPAPSPDVINAPEHYILGRSIEPADAIMDWQLDFFLGNVVKYIARAGRKDDIVQDLKKAQWYLNRAVHKYEVKNK